VRRLFGVAMLVRTLPTQAQDLFHYLFEQASLGIAVEDLDGTLLLVNPALCSILGYPENELRGMNCSQFANAEDSQDDWALFQQLRDGVIGQYSLEKRYVTKGGAQVWGRLNVSLWKNEDDGAPLVFAFLEDITERRRTEEALRASEQRFQLAAYAGRMFSYEWDAATDVVVRSGEYAGLLCTDGIEQRTTGHQIMAKVHPDDRDKVLAAQGALSPEQPDLCVSHRMAGSGDCVVWVERTGRAHFNGEGKLLRVVGMVTEITERKLAEAALADVSRKLIEAQEQERKRIARELHDDIGQRLAMLTIELELLLRQNPPGMPDIRSRLGKLQKQASEITNDVQALSHELHSTKLDYLSPIAAMRSLCQDIGQQTKVQIGFESHDFPTSLPSGISLCLYRVLQEALRNSAKHSGTEHAEVRLWGTPDEIHLTVSDCGAGFDTEAPKAGPGLGLVSMEERLKLLKGTLSVQSQRSRGTTIHARVPFHGEIGSRPTGA
jgi:PAS domain S-box-containing protein